MWFKVEREIETSERDDQWAGAPGTEMAGKSSPNIAITAYWVTLAVDEGLMCGMKYTFLYLFT